MTVKKHLVVESSLLNFWNFLAVVKTLVFSEYIKNYQIRVHKEYIDKNRVHTCVHTQVVLKYSRYDERRLFDVNLRYQGTFATGGQLTARSTLTNKNTSVKVYIF